MCNQKNKESFHNKPHLRLRRQKIMDDLKIRHNGMLAVLDSFNGVGDGDITKKELSEFPLNEWVVIDDGVKVRQRKSLFGNVLQFDTEIEKSKGFNMHKHSDCIEICDVIEGELVNLLTDDVYKAGEQVVWSHGESHVPFAVEKTVLKVYFK